MPTSPSLADAAGDVLLSVARACHDPFAPRSLCFLSTTCCYIRTTLQPSMVDLRALHAAACSLSSKCGCTTSTLSATRCLKWNTKGLDENDAALIAQLASSGSMANLQVLGLHSNQIGDPGMAALSKALGSGSLGNLTHLFLTDNQIGDAGMIEFSRSIANRSMANLNGLYLSINKIGDEGMKAFASAAASGSMVNLTKLDLSWNNIGDVGMAEFSRQIAIAAMGGAMGSLTTLDLSHNNIGDAGLQAFASAIGNGSLAELESLCISNPSYELSTICSSRGIKFEAD